MSNQNRGTEAIGHDLLKRIRAIGQLFPLPFPFPFTLSFGENLAGTLNVGHLDRELHDEVATVFRVGTGSS